MYDPTEVARIKEATQRWEAGALKKTLDRFPERQEQFVTTSSAPVERLYTPADIADTDYVTDIGYPGEYPYTRGVHATLHRGKLWTMRMFAGFGTAEETNARFRSCSARGKPGSRAWPSTCRRSMATTATHPRRWARSASAAWPSARWPTWSRSSIDIPLGEVSTSMTINSPAAIIWAMYIVVGREAGRQPGQAARHLQNDMLKEFIAQKEFLFPIRGHHAPVIRHMLTFVHARRCRCGTPSRISGYHIREAGAPRSRSWPSPWPTASPMWRRRRPRACRSTSSRRGCRSSSTRTTTSSRRSPSTGPARRMWAKIVRDRSTAPRTRGRG
jgi:methylmalonyl-CoA mutase N-terminal domain/subunit